MRPGDARDRFPASGPSARSNGSDSGGQVSAIDLAYAVVHDDPPRVYAAEDVALLQWVIALEVVARTPASSLAPETAEALRAALLAERWGDAVALWMSTSDVGIDVYPVGLRVWTADLLLADVANLRIQFTPLFTD